MPKAASYPHAHRLVRALRLKRGLTQEGLAEAAAIDYKHYQRFELGLAANPELATLDALATALGVKAWVLLCDEPALVRRWTGLRELSSRPARPGRPRKST
jgi:transcriptional regulator with XRE-family HTH domain